LKLPAASYGECARSWIQLLDRHARDLIRTVGHRSRAAGIILLAGEKVGSDVTGTVAGHEALVLRKPIAIAQMKTLVEELKGKHRDVVFSPASEK
jgi:hypothetical protein